MRVNMEWRALREGERRLWSPDLLVRRPAHEFTGFQHPIVLREDLFSIGDYDYPQWNPLNGLLRTVYRTAIWNDVGELVYFDDSRSNVIWSPDGWQFAIGNQIFDGQRSVEIQLFPSESFISSVSFHPTKPWIGLANAMYSLEDLQIEELEPLWKSESSLLWSPNGLWCIDVQQLADSTYCLILRKSDGTEVWRSPNISYRISYRANFIWSPDSTCVYLLRESHLFEIDITHVPPQIMRTKLPSNVLHDYTFALIYPLHWTANGEILVVGTSRQIHLYTKGLRHLRSLIYPTSAHYCMIAPHPHLPLLAVGTWDSMVHMLDLEGHVLDEVSTAFDAKGMSASTMIRIRNSAPLIGTWNPDGTVLALAYRLGVVGLLPLKMRQELLPHNFTWTVRNSSQDMSARFQVTQRFLCALVQQNPHLAWTKERISQLRRSIIETAILRLSHEDGLGELKQLPAEIGVLKHLHDLIIEGTQITDLPPEIGELTYLVSLSITKTPMHELPMEIGQIQNLRTFILSELPLQTLPAEIGNLTALRDLFLSDMPLQHIPAEIGKLTLLRRLGISGLKLSTLPEELAQLHQLESFRPPHVKYISSELEAWLERFANAY